jgi:hypothetical protein
VAVGWLACWREGQQLATSLCLSCLGAVKWAKGWHSSFGVVSSVASKSSGTVTVSLTELSQIGPNLAHQSRNFRSRWFDLSAPHPCSWLDKHVSRIWSCLLAFCWLS